MKRLITVAASAFALATSVGVSARDYVIVSKSQGNGSTSLDAAVAAAGGALTGTQPEIGVAFASSDNPGFAAGVNRAAKHSHAPYLLLLNPDATFTFVLRTRTEPDLGRYAV